MDNPFSIDLPRLREIAEQRGDGISWQKIAEAYPAEEPTLRRAAENALEWEHLLNDARLKSLADAATEAVMVMRQELHSENPKIRMQAATQLLRLHMATMKRKPSSKIGDEPARERDVSFESPFEAVAVDAKVPAGPPSPPVPPESPKPAGEKPARVPTPVGHRGSPVNINRNLLLAPLLSPQRTNRPANGKPR